MQSPAAITDSATSAQTTVTQSGATLLTSALITSLLFAAVAGKRKRPQNKHTG
jgi:hypothetical protein